MKKWIFFAGLLCLGFIAFGTVKSYVDSSKKVASAQDILELFFEVRESVPPLPSPVPYEEVLKQLAEGRMDFVANPTWAYVHRAGTYYLSDKSKLAKELMLPVQLVVYEDLLSETVVLTAISEETANVVTLAMVSAPKVAPYDGSASLESYLLKELGPRRMIWSATLKSEGELLADLLRVEESDAVALSVSPMMMAMSTAEEVTDIRLGIEQLSNSVVSVQVQWPSGFSDTLEIYSATDLVAGDWQFAHTNISTSGSSEYIWNDSRTNSSTRFYVAGNADADEDGDGLPSAREKFIYKTLASLFDTDGDGLGDGVEIACGLNPLIGSSAETLGDADNDGLSNLEEQTAGTDSGTANSSGSTGTVATIRYYYDQDDRLTDCFAGTEVAAQTMLSVAGNIDEDVSAAE